MRESRYYAEHLEGNRQPLAVSTERVSCLGPATHPAKQRQESSTRGRPSRRMMVSLCGLEGWEGRDATRTFTGDQTLSCPPRTASVGRARANHNRANLGLDRPLAIAERHPHAVCELLAEADPKPSGPRPAMTPNEGPVKRPPLAPLGRMVELRLGNAYVALGA